jgi:hypothetical protein
MGWQGNLAALLTLPLLFACSPEKPKEKAQGVDFLQEVAQAEEQSERYAVELACLKNGVALGAAADAIYELVRTRGGVVDMAKYDTAKGDPQERLLQLIGSDVMGNSGQVQALAERHGIPLDVVARVFYDAHMLILTRQASEHPEPAP